MSAKTKYILSGVILIIGAYLVSINILNAFSFDWWIGVVITCTDGVLFYIFRDQYKSGYIRKSESDLLQETEMENAINKEKL